MKIYVNDNSPMYLPVVGTECTRLFKSLSYFSERKQNKTKTEYECGNSGGMIQLQTLKIISSDDYFKNIFDLILSHRTTIYN